MASSSFRTSSVLHSGHREGNTTLGESLARCSVSTAVIFGIISPPFSTYTISPIWRSSRSILSALCSDARLTVVPESSTGSRLAMGVIAPVRPT